MREIHVHKKCGFRCIDKQPVRIYESKRGKIFYFHTGNPKGEFYFNLPKGKYFSANQLEVLKNPIPVNLPKLPAPEKNNTLPKKVKVYFLENPHKASIITANNEIKVDPKILNLTLPTIVFIMFHELGHYFYSDEKKCDLFAAVQMIKRGFNPSQCGIAIDNALSSKSFDRKYCLINKMRKL